MHRGEFLDIIVRRKNLNKTRLAESVGYDRTTYYFHVKQANLDFKILKSYGDKIPYNFSKDFPEMLAEFPENEFPIVTLEAMEKDRDFWRMEYNRVYKEYRLEKEENFTLRTELETLKSKKR